MKLLSFFVLATTIISFSHPGTARAADVYANSVDSFSSAGILSPSHAVGAPDGIYADFLDELSYVRLDMGAGEEGVGDLTLYISILDTGATGTVKFLDDQYVQLDSSGMILPIGVSETVISYTGTEPYRYVEVHSAEEERWRLDAVETLELAESEPDPEPEPAPEPEPDPEPEPSTFETGDLIKLADQSAVYIIGDDLARHAFPNDAVFNGWFANTGFDSVQMVDLATMADVPLRGNVTMRPGNLVKIVSSPYVYAIEPGGVLRWVTTEEIAVQLYGTAWAERVSDVDVSFWNNYTLGDDLDAAVHPDGSILQAADESYWYIQNGTRFEMSEADFLAMEIDPKTVITDDQEFLLLYMDGGAFDDLNDLRFPY